MTLTALLRLARHELTLYTSLMRWLFRRPPHGVDAAAGDSVMPYSRGQWAISAIFFFVSVVETVALAFLIPWPLVHGVLLALGLWGIFFVVALQAAYAVRPHVIGGDGSLRLRCGALLEIRVPAGGIAAARLERRFPGNGLLRLEEDEDGDGTVELPVGGQTNLTVELTEPVTFTRPLGRPARARVLRFYADEPGPALAVLRGSAVR
ncbi:hypothetical protein [Streptomyces sp. 6N223]|uniref:hypothetical protein n=1 Tax=Streptomyces sp. 6N223 TaxID=3457412 RepID=UPI003FD32003